MLLVNTWRLRVEERCKYLGQEACATCNEEVLARKRFLHTNFRRSTLLLWFLAKIYLKN